MMPLALVNVKKMEQMQSKMLTKARMLTPKSIITIYKDAIHAYRKFLSIWSDKIYADFHFPGYLKDQ